MPRPADKIFLRIAVDNRVLEAQDADDVWAEMTRLEREGEKVKARVLCVELGFMDQGLARKIKHQVRATLERMVREESRGQRQVAGFELFEKLSSGAMGTVYKARHLKLGKIVALKLLNPDMAKDESYVARFLLEAQAAATLNHPNVVQAYDVGQTGNVHFIAMEYVEGKTLKELIKRRGQIEESAAVEIVLQLVDGLRHAWENRLVHRDVKPANIMITREGVTKLLDLGLVKRTDQVSELTGDGRAVGTPYFMAPEQALDKGTDYRSDIYGLGATLFNLVTGEKPYVAATPVAVMNMHLKAPIPDASEVHRKVSKGLAQVITKMLAKRPADRYQDPERLIHDLTTVLQGFMPDLKGGETPVGLDFIAPRGEGGGSSSGQRRGKKGSAPQHSGYARRGRQPGGDEDELEGDDDEPQRNWLPIVIAAAAGILIGVVVFLNSGNEPKKVVIPDEPEVAEVDPLEEAEKTASKIYAALASEDWVRISDLEAIAESYKKTPTAKKARSEARDLRTTLTRAEEQRYDEGDRRLTEFAVTGRLRAAVDGYTDLHTDLHVEGLKRRAKQRADELIVLLKERSDAAEAQAKKFESQGDERKAAEIRRERAKNFLSEEEAKQEETRAVALEKKATDRERAAGEERQREIDLERQREEARVAALPTNIVTLVKEEELDAALSLATETANVITSAPLKDRAKVHVQALEAIRNLQPLALSALAKRPDATVSFQKKKGGKISGSLAGVTDDTITVKVLRGALLSVTLDELVENVTWTWARRAEGKAGAAYLRGVTSLKLYRSDNDALKYLAQCQEAGVDLSALVAELRRVEPSDQPVTGGGGGGEEGTDPQPASTDRPKTPAEKRAEAEAKRKRAELLIASRKNLFREADDVGYEGVSGRVEPIYEFHQDGRKFRKEWRVVRGTASPTPPGNFERQGLRLLGNDGRAEFIAPLQNDLDIIIRFLSWGNDKRGRLVVALEGEKGRRVLCNIGAIDFRVKRKLKLRRGASRIASFRNGADVKFEIIRQGRFIITKINTDETAKIELPEDEDLDNYRLVLEWGRVSISLLRIRMLCQPTDEWIKKRLKQN